ncbi:MAG: sodium:proton exchanger [Proteobacteria bacterium]|nr:sodium:proton exchanger [Pseudomonadota bacterium]MDA0994143.1 sodium:proton exchanger [Pseudomonadota bacterium]
MQDYGFLSIVPPLLTIAVALYSKNVLVALIVGIASGSFIIADFHPFNAMLNAIEEQVLAEFTNGTQSQVIITMMVIGGFVKLLEVSGGAKAFAQKMLSIVSTGARAQMLAWLSGLGIFFTDSGNSLIIGPLYRSVFDEFRLCREKLAYILDTTSSPISILIPFIGWGAYIMSLIEKSYAEVGLTENEFTVLIKVIPYQFYAFLALLTVPIVIYTGKDYGPMKRIQAEYLQNLKFRHTERADRSSATDTPVGMFLYPLGVMLALVGALISWHATHGGITGAHIRSTLILSYLTASLTCMAMMRRHQGKSFTEMMGIFITGAESLVYVSIILVLAWSLSSVTSDLHTANYLASLIGDSVSASYFPMIVFALGALISLSTGSSYGTFAILMAIAVPVGFDLGASMYVTIAAVLSGGLFGDHCSPISDTTVLASVGADCNHLNHVTTQGAYAGLTGIVTLFAYWMAGFYESPYVLLVAIVILYVAMTTAMRFFGSLSLPTEAARL